MLVHVKLFAAARQLAGADAIRVDVGEAPTVAALRTALAEQFPELAALLPHALFAVNTEYASPETVIPPQAEVACIPPVSGG